MKSKRARDAAAVVDDNDAAMAVDSPIAKKRKRDDEATDDVKQKKAKKDKKDKKDKKKDKKESRKEKKDKRKDLQDLPEEDVADESPVAEVQATNGDETTPKKDKKDKKDKKEKKEKKKDKASNKDAAVNGEEKTNGDESKKSKKDKKEKKKAKKAAEAETPAAANGDEEQDGEDADDKKDRHIVFVGNLPFSATEKTIKAHFASLNPTSVRCLKNKDDSNPCRGIAFVEFANVWTQRTCLDKFHHTMFNDGVSAPRKINVELTAGGGGKTKHRQDKIREKNKKLDENRFKRIEREKAAKEEGGAKKEEPHVGGIHPSRLARNPGLAH